MIDSSSSPERYVTMAEVYDAWMAHDKVPYDAWASHIVDLVKSNAPQAERWLDLGCGTGQMLERIQSHGYVVQGADASEGMIARARMRLPEAPLYVRRLPRDGIADLGSVDVVTACFDVLNYLVEPGQFAETVAQVAAVLPAGGLFFFDLNTRYKLEQVFGGYNTGDDAGDFAYVWRNRYDAASKILTAYVTFFVRDEEGRFWRSTETHQETWRDPSEVTATLTEHGFELLALSDGYSDSPATTETLRHTWFARRV